MTKCINLLDKKDTKNITTLQRIPAGIYEECSTSEELTMIVAKMRILPTEDQQMIHSINKTSVIN